MRLFLAVFLLAAGLSLPAFAQTDQYMKGDCSAAASGSATCTTLQGGAVTVPSSGALVTSLSGDITTGPANGSGAATATLPSVVAAGTYGVVTADTKGRVTGGSAISPQANGGTGYSSVTAALDGLFGSSQGSILFRGASTWASLGAGAASYLLQSNGIGTNPSWVTPPSGAPAGPGSTPRIITASATLNAADSFTAVNNTSGVGVSVTLPATPVLGQWYVITDYSRTANGYPITVLANTGQSIIMGANPNASPTITTTGGSRGIIFISATIAQVVL